MENPNKYKSSLTLGRASMASSLESSETCVCRSEIDVGSVPIASTLQTNTPVLGTGLLSTTPGSGPGQSYREMLCQLIEKYNAVSHDVSVIDEVVSRLVKAVGEDTGEIASVIETIASIKQRLLDIDESFTIVTKRIDGLDEKSTILSSMYEALVSRVDYHGQRIDDVEDSISEVAEELDAMHVTIDSARDSINGLEKVYADMLDDNAGIHADLDNIGVSVRTLSLSLAELSNRVDIIEQGTAGEIDKQIEELKKGIASANDSINGLTNVYESLDSRVTSNELAISAANVLLSAIQKDIADIKKALDDGSGCICDMEAIKKDIAGIHDSLNGLSNVYETLSADVNVNTEAIGALQKANESIRHSLDALDKRIEDVAEAAGSKSEFLAEINAIKDNINGIENVIDAMKAVDVSAEARLDTAENAIRLLQEEIKDIIDHGVDHELLEQIQEEQVEQRKKMDQISGDNAYLEATWLQMLTDHGIKGDDMKLITMSEYRAIRPKLMKYYFVTTDENPKQLYRLYLFNKPIFEFDVRGNISVAFPKVFPTLLV